MATYHNISWLYLTNKQEFKSLGSVCTNRLFLQLIIPLCLLLCQGFFLHWSFALSWVPFASLCVWLEGKDRVKMAEASVPARGLEQITYDIKHMAAVRKEKRRDKKSVFFFLSKKKNEKEKQNGFIQERPPLFSVRVQPLFFSPFRISPKTGMIKSTHVSPTAKHSNRDVCRLCPFIQPTESLYLFTRAIWEENMLIYMHYRAILEGEKKLLSDAVLCLMSLVEILEAVYCDGDRW